MFSGDVLKQRRKEKGLKQSELAKLCNISPITISRYENNVFIPKLEHLEKLAAALECSPMAFDSIFLIDAESDEHFKNYVANSERLKFNPSTVHAEALAMNETGQIKDFGKEFIKILSDYGLGSDTLTEFLCKTDNYYALLVFCLDNLCLLNDKGLQKVLEYTNDLLHNPDYTKSE